MLASLAMETFPSLLPKGTSQNGPPMRKVASLAAAVRMSAHETVFGHLFSTSDLISSITWNPLSVLLPSLLLSLPVWFSKIDASHPCTLLLQCIHVKSS